jgi:hypothetical protein
MRGDLGEVTPSATGPELMSANINPPLLISGPVALGVTSPNSGGLMLGHAILALPQSAARLFLS